MFHVWFSGIWYIDRPHLNARIGSYSESAPSSQISSFLTCPFYLKFVLIMQIVHMFAPTEICLNQYSVLTVTLFGTVQMGSILNQQMQMQDSVISGDVVSSTTIIVRCRRYQSSNGWRRGLDKGNEYYSKYYSTTKHHHQQLIAPSTNTSFCHHHDQCSMEIIYW